jgi:hypothetical protein
VEVVASEELGCSVEAEMHRALLDRGGTTVFCMCSSLFFAGCTCSFAMQHCLPFRILIMCVLYFQVWSLLLGWPGEDSHAPYDLFNWRFSSTKYMYF